jgi:hypothetical protein
MRSENESERIHLVAVELLKKKGIAAENATFDQYADAAQVACEVVASGKETAAEALAVAALPADLGTPNEATIRALAKLAHQGKFIRDGSVTADELVAAVADAEQATTVAAEGGDEYCPTCGYHLHDYGCQCR